MQDKQGYVSVITELELIGFPDITVRESQRIKNFLDDCTLVEINDEIKSIYVHLRKRYLLKLGDAKAAATSIYLDLPFMSAYRDFSKVTESELSLYHQ